MKKLVLGFIMAFSMMACNTDNDVAFNFNPQMIVLQQNTDGSAKFIPTLWVTSTSFQHKLSKVNIYSASSAFSFKMEKYNDYYFVSKADTIDRLQDLVSTYVIKAFSETGEVAEKSSNYSISDTLIMEEMLSSDMQYSSGKLSVKMSKVSKATGYGFSVCTVQKDSLGVEQYYRLGTTYLGGSLLRKEGDDMIIGLELSLPSNAKCKICPIAYNSALIMEGPAKIWDGKTLN